MRSICASVTFTKVAVFVWYLGLAAVEPAAARFGNLALRQALEALEEKFIVKFSAFTPKIPGWSSLLLIPCKNGLRKRGSVTVNCT